MVRTHTGRALLILGLVAACRPMGSAAQQGTTVRQWHGIGVREGPECDCCGLVFPERFGANDPRQLALIRELAGGEGRAKELGCFLAYKRQALRHLTALATKYQDRPAASIVLNADSEGGADLGGGDLSEAVGGEFMVPVLLDFKALKELLNPKLSEHVARCVCLSAMVFGKVDEGRLNASLRARALGSLADKIELTCSKMRQGKD